MLELSQTMLRGIHSNGPTDPIEYYRHPVVGRLYLRRINIGFGLLPMRRFPRALEVGYGAGAVLLALAPAVEDLHGIDLDAEPKSVERLLESRGHRATLKQASVYELPYDSQCFDLVVSFSVFEHLHEYRRALSEVYRVLTPGGLFLLGMPSVNRMMEYAFLAIGFKGIDDHHVTTPRQVSDSFEQAGFREIKSRFLDFPARVPFGLRLYHDWLLQRPHDGTQKR